MIIEDLMNYFLQGFIKGILVSIICFFIGYAIKQVIIYLNKLN